MCQRIEFIQTVNYSPLLVPEDEDERIVTSGSRVHLQPPTRVGARSVLLELLFVVGVLAIAKSPVHGAEITLVADGESAYTIVLPVSAGDVERFAAEELQCLLEEMTGARLPLAYDADTINGPALHVGATAEALLHAPLPQSRFPQDDTYRLAVRGRDVFITGALPRATLFATYDLLERLGCRWFAPGYRFYKGLHERVPSLTTLSLDAGLDVVERPDFEFRQEFCEHYYMHEPDDVVALIDWCAKNRINTFTVRLNEFSPVWYRILEPECARRGLLLTVEAHAFDRFLSRSEYFHDHPEWFGRVDGLPSDKYFDQFRLTHPDAVAEFTQNLQSFVRAYPGLYSIAAMPNDSPRWVDEDLAGHSSVELLLKSYELIASTVYKTNPNMKVSIGVGVTYFGQDGTEIWESPYPNVTWHTAVLRRTQKYAWNDPASELNYTQYTKAAEVTRRLLAAGEDVVWSSRYAPFRDMCLPGLIYPRQMAAELRDLHGMGGSGVNFNYAIPPAWIPYEVKHLLFAELTWDVSSNPEALLDTYYQERYPGSPVAIKRFYDHLRRAMERYEHPGGGYSRAHAFGLYPEDQFDTAFSELRVAADALDEAMATNPEAGEKQLIWLLKASLEFAQGKLEVDRLDQTGEREAAATRTVELMDYLEVWEGRGIVYDSSFLRMGLERRFLGPPRDRPMKNVPVDNLRVYEYLDYLPPGEIAHR